MINNNPNNQKLQKGTGHLQLGQKAEMIAENYLVAQGYQILQNNYFNRQGYRVGEIDLIAIDKEGKIVFVEVKARRQNWADKEVVPEENITTRKIRKIQKAANYYLLKNGRIGADWRIESIGIIFNFSSRKLKIRHIKNIRI